MTREYYFNDTGAQVKNLGASILAIREGREIPADGYHGEYVVDLAPELPDELAAVRPSPDGGDPEEARAWAAGQVGLGSDPARASRPRSPRSASASTSGRPRARLIEGGWVDQAIGRLRAGGHLYEEDGATWFRSTAFGDDKDRVVIRSNGSLTYFAFDIGYVVEKFSRGFDHLIYIWGADHHGTVARVRNAAEAMGYDKGAGRDDPHRLGPLRGGRPGALDVEAGGHVHRCSTTCSRSSASTPRGGTSRAAART